MDIKDFTKRPSWGICLYKVPYVKDKKIISPGIIIFNKTFIYRNPKSPNKIDNNIFEEVLNLDKDLWIKGIYNSGSLSHIKMRKERWKKNHETSIEDWEKFDFALPFRKGIANIFTIPLSRCSFINPKYFKPANNKKYYNLLLVDHFSSRFKTQLLLAKAIKRFRKKYKQDLRVLFLGSVRSKSYKEDLTNYLNTNKIRYKIKYLKGKDYVKEINKSIINLTLRQDHGSPRAVTETASCNLPQIITDGIRKNSYFYFYENILNNK